MEPVWKCHPERSILYRTQKSIRHFMNRYPCPVCIQELSLFPSHRLHLHLDVPIFLFLYVDHMSMSCEKSLSTGPGNLPDIFQSLAPAWFRPSVRGKYCSWMVLWEIRKIHELHWVRRALYGGGSCSKIVHILVLLYSQTSNKLVKSKQLFIRRWLWEDKLPQEGKIAKL